MPILRGPRPGVREVDGPAAQVGDVDLDADCHEGAAGGDEGGRLNGRRVGVRARCMVLCLRRCPDVRPTRANLSALVDRLVAAGMLTGLHRHEHLLA